MNNGVNETYLIIKLLNMEDKLGITEVAGLFFIADRHDVPEKVLW